MKTGLIAGLCLVWSLAGCAEAEGPAASPPADRTVEGAPYVLKGTQVWTVPDPAQGRDYQVFVSLPPSYDSDAERRYPVLYVTDADYAFPILRQITRRLNLQGPVVEEFILVGLSYAVGEDGVASRNRDYTPTAKGVRDAAAHGGGPAYQRYLKDQVLPFIEGRFRADPERRVLLGHSYGGLLGGQILFTEPEMFSAYVLGSPSIWFAQRHLMRMETAYAQAHDDLPAEVFIYIGGWERPGPSRRNTRDTDMVADVRALESALKGRGYPSLKISTQVLEDEDHLSVAPLGFTRALVAVLPAKDAPAQAR
ncbi:alpha/beta hydrolase [Phenylobacterium sp.]|uniref:alpha/beta hydrolase n=1 Tax=Phenylobacterium sp. TaxID=1871053 RepID=UPI002FD9F5AB